MSSYLVAYQCSCNNAHSHLSYCMSVLLVSDLQSRLIPLVPLARKCAQGIGNLNKGIDALVGSTK